MINIFNLFLTLFFFWALFAYSNDNLSWLYIVFGLVASIATSFTAWKIKIINKHSRFLFLHLGFYKHFLGLIFSSFFQSLLIIFRVAISSFKIDPKINTSSNNTNTTNTTESNNTICTQIWDTIFGTN